MPSRRRSQDIGIGIHAHIAQILVQRYNRLGHRLPLLLDLVRLTRKHLMTLLATILFLYCAVRPYPLALQASGREAFLHPAGDNGRWQTATVG